MAVQRGLADLLGERGVALVELLLDLVEDALFVFGERHRPNSLVGGTPVGPVEAIIAQGADGDNAVRGRPGSGVRRVRTPLLLAPAGQAQTSPWTAQAGGTDG